MSWKNIHENDKGVRLELTVTDTNGTALDISSFTTKKYVFVDPIETVSEVTASFVSDGSDGKLFYILSDGDIDTDGEWKVAARLEKVDTRITSVFQSFVVMKNHEVA